MIDEVSLVKRPQTFKGALQGLTSALRTMDKYPMVNVSFVDTVSTNVPRTIVDLQTTGVPAAAETARREFSGLAVNCLLPSFFVLGLAKLMNKGFMKNFKDVDMSSSWANQETIEKLVSFYQNSKNKDRIKGFVENTFENLEGLDGEKWSPFKNIQNPKSFERAVDKMSELIKAPKLSKKESADGLKNVYKNLMESVCASNALRFKGDKEAFGSTLSEFLRDSLDLGRKFQIPDVADNLDKFKGVATKMINAKSLLGLGVIIPFAMSVQHFNRKMTQKKYNKKGAPIYKDFQKGNTHKEMNSKEKKKFFGQKILAASSMVGLAVLSMMKKPNLKMFQFKGMFPTIDQCRWIATATFISRMFAAEDKNELRESTVRDIASFSGLYFLGDYAAKGAASLIEKIKPDIKLLNSSKKIDTNADSFQKIGHWVKNKSLKSFDEVQGVMGKNMRSVCQMASLGFSVLTLGVLLPAYNRRVTEKKVQKERAAEFMAKEKNFIAKKPVPEVFMGFMGGIKKNF